MNKRTSSSISEIGAELEVRLFSRHRLGSQRRHRGACFAWALGHKFRGFSSPKSFIQNDNLKRLNLASLNFLSYLRLTRPANLLTAVADILAGMAAATALAQLTDKELGWEFLSALMLPSVGFFLILSTIGLYGGGIVFNDVFDAELDAIERPERPIPSGKASKTGASILGILLLSMGIISAFVASIPSGIIAISIAILALVYDKWGKHHNGLGPINMGLCRGLNLLLGVSLYARYLDELMFLAMIPIIFIGAITMISRGEVHGGDRKTLWGAFALYLGVIFFLLGLSFLSYFQLNISLIFIVGFAAMVFPPLIAAIRVPSGPNIMKAVKLGVMSLILMDAAMAAGFMGWKYGLFVLFLLPLSILTARMFSVT